MVKNLALLVSSVFLVVATSYSIKVKPPGREYCCNICGKRVCSKKPISCPNPRLIHCPKKKHPSHHIGPIGPHHHYQPGIEPQ